MEDISIEDAVKTSAIKRSKKEKFEDEEDDEGCIFGLSGEIIRNIELKKILLLFIILIIVHSSIYMNRVLVPVEGATVGLSVTSKGSLIQISSVVTMFSIANFLVNTKFL